MSHDKSRRQKKVKATEKLQEILDRRGITLYKLAKLTGIRYELLRRSFHGKRRMSADEYLYIMEILTEE